MTAPSGSLRGASPRGRVWAHVGQPFTETAYDVVVVGAGRMGAFAARELRRLAPALRLLLVEEGGLPNEEGATLLAPGVWTARDAPPGREAEAAWTRAQLAATLGDVQFRAAPLAELGAGADPHPDARPTGEALADWPEALALLDPVDLPWARVDAGAATFRPGAVALNAAQEAVRLGADLLLNTRACPGEGGRMTLERLSVTNTHEVVVHERRAVQAAQVLLAAGAAGPALAEHALGVHTAHGRAYRQAPRLERPSGADSPTLRAGGLTLRPQAGGWTLVPAIWHRDPQGYVPAGGLLTGVLTGLRRETLEDLVALMDAVPALAGGGLGLGRSLSDVPGAWLALPGGRPDAPPLWQRLDDTHTLLLGGPLADVLGLSVAHDLAATLAGTEGRPWAPAD
ncbi:FAD-dependent oxidoreductase [Deinococcus petrolearius]|uniref:FAD-dependent oxidoreductase n=1 Tax=Deinococcus petrolearius TaxID=1751295 RepID=A0ABW1DK13_9DEIO